MPANRYRPIKTKLLLACLLVWVGLFQYFQLKPQPVPEPTSQIQKYEILHAYLLAKDSPLAPYAEFILEQKHWRLLVAISNIESQFCKRKLSYNCWGIGGDSHYRHYAGYEEAIIDFETFVEKWKSQGKWQTVEQMNCSYVVPCNPNWVFQTNKTLADLESILPE